MHIGIDPGLSGAVAVLAADGALVALHDTPVLTLSTSHGTRQKYDLPGLVALLAPYAGPQAHVILEESQAMPGQGTRSMFTVGIGLASGWAFWARWGSPIRESAPTSGNATWGSPGTKNRPGCGRCSFSLAPICDGRKIMGGPRRYYWRGGDSNAAVLRRYTMDVTTVEQAVTTLRQQGTPVSVRQVQRLTGGSLRDVSRILRTLADAAHPQGPRPHGATETASGQVVLTVPHAVAAAFDGLHHALQRDARFRADVLLWARKLERGSYSTLGPLSGLIAALGGGEDHEKQRGNPHNLHT